VPSLQERSGDFGPGVLTGNVSGPYTATLLSRELGYPVAQGEPYSAVFPGGVIPQKAWSAPAQHLLQYIPAPNIGSNLFSTSAFPETVRDDKGAGRIDANTKIGQVSGYYLLTITGWTIRILASRAAPAYPASMP